MVSMYPPLFPARRLHLNATVFASFAPSVPHTHTHTHTHDGQFTLCVCVCVCVATDTVTLSNTAASSSSIRVTELRLVPVRHCSFPVTRIPDYSHMTGEVPPRGRETQTPFWGRSATSRCVHALCFDKHDTTGRGRNTHTHTHTVYMMFFAV